MMPHQNTTSSKATSQNAATDSVMPNDQAREQHRSSRLEPRSYAAADVADATLAPPAAGEVGDYMDEGDALAADGQQQGRDRIAGSSITDAKRGQGPKTRTANRNLVRRRPAEAKDGGAR
jgi:hypothetical protein